MLSNTLLPSKYFYKLQVNRLKANDIKSDNIIPTSPSYLFSAVFKMQYLIEIIPVEV